MEAGLGHIKIAFDKTSIQLVDIEQIDLKYQSNNRFNKAWKVKVSLGHVEIPRRITLSDFCLADME